ncbi:HAD family hydrolase [Asanoa siamensis]|uniref:Hydrolase n=1 Tax=Asanoa siamensis TaxID=926357 RepID=A0ABQ4CVI6_9ACTN|nr:HAD family phosphatase [Asanoa siamensis]GIF75299.1 hydrolase [Asanoa siamensis]
MNASANQLAQLIRDRSLLLLDFDGPVCSVFAGYPARSIASELRQMTGVNTTDFNDENDPLRLLMRLSRVARPEVTQMVANALREKEILAIETAMPTPGSAELIRAARASGRQIAIVSNNSIGAIHAYLASHGLASSIDHVSARYDGMNPARLKPDAELLRRALAATGVAPDRAIFIGDSLSDVAAGTASNIHTIGYANRRSKKDALRAAGAVNVVEDLMQIVVAL